MQKMHNSDGIAPLNLSKDSQTNHYAKTQSAQHKNNY